LYDDLTTRTISMACRFVHGRDGAQLTSNKLPILPVALWPSLPMPFELQVAYREPASKRGGLLR